MSGEPLYLVGAIAGRRVAIDASRVDSVIDIATVQPVPCAAPAILGLAALRSRVLTVVDCATALGLGDEAPCRVTSAMPAIVVDLEGYLYGFVLDRVDDVLAADRPMAPAGAPLGGPWSAVSPGIVEFDGAALPLVDPAALLANMASRAA
jgi:purine-binding chemotaxis protein CheW